MKFALSGMFDVADLLGTILRKSSAGYTVQGESVTVYFCETRDFDGDSRENLEIFGLLKWYIPIAFFRVNDSPWERIEAFCAGYLIQQEVFWVKPHLIGLDDYFVDVTSY